MAPPTKAYQDIAELRSLRSASQIVRLPPGVDVPLTGRIKKLVDTHYFRRLSSVSQLGLVSLVYPGAVHSRFEHSLGVYRNALLVLERLTAQAEFRELCSPPDCEAFLAAALLHDVGHYPYAHLIEDMRLPGLRRHELLAADCLGDEAVRGVLEREFGIEPAAVLRLLAKDYRTPGERLLGSMLSGPIDIDKLDYLDRDSMHAGVPYGRNFDSQRLISQLCVDAERQRLAITQKATTAAEMMVFARYVMFREVYWHHAVRAATAMLQRCFYTIGDRKDFQRRAAEMSDGRMQAELLDAVDGAPGSEIAEGLFGGQRRLHKRVAQYDVLDRPELHAALARRPYPQLAEIADAVGQRLAAAVGEPIAPGEILIDAPPTKLEVQFDVRVLQPSGAYRDLGEVSPVVRTLATDQFDSIVKRVRVFAAPQLLERLRSIDLDRIVLSVCG